MLERIRHVLARPVDTAGLGSFRAVFGGLVFIGTIRLLAKGYVHEAFIAPHTFFPPWPFESVLRPLPGPGMYAVYVAIAVFALALALGLYTRLSAAVTCVLFTYAHFIDLTNYLNHYWLVTLLTGLLAIVPAGGALSLDARLRPSRRRDEAPAWTLYLLRFQVAIVYFFAGLAKLRSDWLFSAQPLRTWLLANTDMPVLGTLFHEPWVAYAMSWTGAFFDLTIVGWLLWRKSRPFAYAAVVTFHLITARLFNIGMFPFFMMAASLLFLDPSWPRRFVKSVREESRPSRHSRRAAPLVPLALYALIQVLVPLRPLFYGSNLLWHEQGFRFGWRVMVMEKMGAAEFAVVDRETGIRRAVRVRDHLTSSQEKAMATQPDMILAFAQHLADEEHRRGREVAVYADAFVVLNGRPATRFIDPNVDLGTQGDGFSNKSWILPPPP